ncbi:MAG: Gfo/Idh/MocA family oxidoreductase [Chloroflexota bacterium]|nr:MAG: Gfo/Idh/MocA family oxidoreductase [Chloroflexota bacterium]
MDKNSEHTKPVRAALIGCGSMARYHLLNILNERNNTVIPVVCEPSADQYDATLEVFKAAGRQAPHNEPELARLLTDHAAGLDAVFIITPHVYHLDQAVACLEAGLDVLLEKPMTMNAAEAQSLIEVRDKTGRLLVVAFNGTLSPEIQKARELIAAGEVGQICSISATVWQNWRELTDGTWRQAPEMSGGGFLFDTGAHMLNTVSDLAGQDIVQVAAWLEDRGTPVDIDAVVLARLASGAMITLHGSGNTVPSVASDILLFGSQAILRTGVWGERLHIQRYGEEELTPVQVPESSGAWEQFLAIRSGRIPNVSPPELGLRMNRLWDAIRASAAQDGAVVECGSTVNS